MRIIKHLINTILISTLAACTIIDTRNAPPNDWPALEIKVTHLGFFDTQAKCGGNIIMQTAACAFVDFDTRTCYVYTATDDPSVMEHEQWHCKGYDHVGSNQLHKEWAKWKRKHGKRP